MAVFGYDASDLHLSSSCLWWWHHLWWCRDGQELRFGDEEFFFYLFWLLLVSLLRQIWEMTIFAGVDRIISTPGKWLYSSMATSTESPNMKGHKKSRIIFAPGTMMSGIVVLADMELGLMLDIEYKPGRSLLPSYSLICCFVLVVLWCMWCTMSIILFCSANWTIKWWSRWTTLCAIDSSSLN